MEKATDWFLISQFQKTEDWKIPSSIWWRLKKENHFQALKNFNLALEYGDHAEIYLFRGITQISLFHYKSAASDLTIFIDNVSESHPDYANALNKRGLSLFFMKRLDEACVDWSYSYSIERDDDTKTFIKKHCLN